MVPIRFSFSFTLPFIFPFGLLESIFIRFKSAILILIIAIIIMTRTATAATMATQDKFILPATATALIK